MQHTQGKLVVFAIVLVLAVIACNMPAFSSVYQYGGLDEDICKSVGGKWVPDEDGGVCIEPTFLATSSEVAEDETSADIYLMKPCEADYYQYKWDFANVVDEDRNQTKHVCSGDLILRNTSNDRLDFKLYEKWDNGAMQQEGWDEGYYRLEPGEEYSLYFETQSWTDGRSTVATYPKLIVFRATSECASLLSDDIYQDLWESIAVSLDDPCQ